MKELNKGKRAALALLAASALVAAGGLAQAAAANGSSRNADKIQALLQARRAAQTTRPGAVLAPIIVSSGNLSGWTIQDGHCDGGVSTGSVSFVSGPATPPLGAGSARYSVGADGDSFENLRNPNYNLTPLSSLTALSYSTYVSHPGSGGQAPYVVLNLDLDNDPATIDDQLFFEPTYQDGTYSGDPIPNQCGTGPNCVVPGSWQNWDALVGGWWTANEGTGGPPLHTIANYSAAHPGARIVNSSAGGGLRVVAGCGGADWTNFEGNLDNLTVNSTTYNFDLNPTPNAYALLAPQSGAPANGGSVVIGSQFNLDMMVNSGTNDVTVAQSYLSFTNPGLQNAQVGAPGCVVTNTVTADPTGFGTEIQNEVCNSSAPCDFGRISGPPSSIAFASGATPGQPSIRSNTPFRVAQVRFCALALGPARIHWQFGGDRDSFVVDESGNTVSSPSLYSDYVVNVVEPKLVGHVTWEGAPAQPNPRQQQPITLTLKSGTVEYNFTNLTTDASGFFTVPVTTLSSGTWQWRAKGPKSLANAGTFSYSRAVFTNVNMDTVTVTCPNGCLRGGDATNDNRVNASDYNIFRASSGKQLGDPGYDSRADFTNDNMVDISDFNLLKRNFGFSGSGPLVPGGGKPEK